MTVASKPVVSARELPDLYSGDRMSREDFHRIYQQTPESFKAELIGGIVYVASPLKIPHGTSHPYLTTAFLLYAGNTSGVEVGDNTTILLGEDGEPQPDLYLRILPDYGGQSKTTIDEENGKEEFVDGAPELIAEIAHSSVAIDLHAKREDYRRYGVREYLVLSLKEQQLRWFDLPNNQELRIGDDGILRAKTFPGLWIHGPALLAKNFEQFMATLNAGLATPERKEFMRELAVRKRPPA